MKKLVYPMLALAAAAIGLLLYNATFNKTITPQVTFISIKGERIATGDLRGLHQENAATGGNAQENLILI